MSSAGKRSSSRSAVPRSVFKVIFRRRLCAAGVVGCGDWTDCPKAVGGWVHHPSRSDLCQLCNDTAHNFVYIVDGENTHGGGSKLSSQSRVLLLAVGKHLERASTSNLQRCLTYIGLLILSQSQVFQDRSHVETAHMSASIPSSANFWTLAIAGTQNTVLLGQTLRDRFLETNWMLTAAERVTMARPHAPHIIVHMGWGCVLVLQAGRENNRYRRGGMSKRSFALDQVSGQNLSGTTGISRISKMILLTEPQMEHKRWRFTGRLLLVSYPFCVGAP